MRKRINPFDIFGMLLILSSLIGVTYHRIWWLIYAIGCGLWIILNIRVGYYGGAIMNFVAIIIAIVNYIKV